MSAALTVAVLVLAVVAVLIVCTVREVAGELRWLVRRILRGWRS